jgi:hypothetical protein
LTGNSGAFQGQFVVVSGFRRAGDGPRPTPELLTRNPTVIGAPPSAVPLRVGDRGGMHITNRDHLEPHGVLGSGQSAFAMLSKRVSQLLLPKRPHFRPVRTTTVPAAGEQYTN